jgi:hypothetical protein
MNFERLRSRVDRAESLFDGRIAQVRHHRSQLDREVRQAITPGRIVVAGLLAGFVVGRARPMRAIRAVSATRWLQLATSLSGLLASLKAAYAAQMAETAAEEAGDAAETAEAVAEETGVAATGVAATGAAATGAPASAVPAPDAMEARASQPAADARRRPDTPFEREPRPAEAATEISER